MFASFQMAKIISNIICNTNDIDGFDKLDPDEKVFITNLVGQETAFRSTSPLREYAKKKRQ